MQETVAFSLGPAVVGFARGAEVVGHEPEHKEVNLPGGTPPRWAEMLSPPYYYSMAWPGAGFLTTNTAAESQSEGAKSETAQRSLSITRQQDTRPRHANEQAKHHDLDGLKLTSVQIIGEIRGEAFRAFLVNARLASPSSTEFSVYNFVHYGYEQRRIVLGRNFERSIN